MIFFICLISSYFTTPSCFFFIFDYYKLWCSSYLLTISCYFLYFVAISCYFLNILLLKADISFIIYYYTLLFSSHYIDIRCCFFIFDDYELLVSSYMAYYKLLFPSYFITVSSYFHHTLFLLRNYYMGLIIDWLDCLVTVRGPQAAILEQFPMAFTKYSHSMKSFWRAGVPRGGQNWWIECYFRHYYYIKLLSSSYYITTSCFFIFYYYNLLFPRYVITIRCYFLHILLL